MFLFFACGMYFHLFLLCILGLTDIYIYFYVSITRSPKKEIFILKTLNFTMCFRCFRGVDASYDNYHRDVKEKGGAGLGLIQSTMKQMK